MDDDFEESDRKKFAEDIKAAYYQMTGYHLRLEQRAYCPKLTSFRLYGMLAPELRKNIWDYSRSSLPYTLRLHCAKKFQIIDKEYYEVTCLNFAEFMTLNEANIARITDLKITWLTTKIDLPRNYDSVRDRNADFRTQGATMESSNSLKSLTLDLSKDRNGCAYHFRTMRNMILATNSKISNVTLIFRVENSGPSYASYERYYSAKAAATLQLGVPGASFYNQRENIIAICWEGDAKEMKESVQRNAA